MFAVLAGLFFALSSIFTRWGLERASSGAAVLVTALANVVVFWPLFLIFAPFSSISSWAVLAFIAAGATGPFLARMLLFNGMARVGVSVATPLYNIQVLFAVIGGVLFFNETLTPFVGLGTVVLLGGPGIRVLLCDFLHAQEVGVADNARGVLGTGNDGVHVILHGLCPGSCPGKAPLLP
jgi:drug/metabolite transporter (DMT)-like permease